MSLKMADADQGPLTVRYIPSIVYPGSYDSEPLKMLYGALYLPTLYKEYNCYRKLRFEFSTNNVQ